MLISSELKIQASKEAEDSAKADLEKEQNKTIGSLLNEEEKNTEATNQERNI
jgi:hypothetical protein